LSVCLSVFSNHNREIRGGCMRKSRGERKKK
jgi:hypothetical protein